MDSFLFVRCAGAPTAPARASVPVWLAGQAQLQARAVPRPLEDFGAALPGSDGQGHHLRPWPNAAPGTAASWIPVSEH